MKKSIFQELVEESIVLLKNEEQILPLKEKKVAFLGRAQIETIFSGNGSGASKSLANKNLLCECEKKRNLCRSRVKTILHQPSKKRIGKVCD